MDDLLQEFIAETRESLDSVSGDIVAWAANPDDRALLDSVFRFAHNVKGSCGYLDMPRLVRLSHAAENAMADVRDGRRSPDGPLVAGVLAIIDRIGAIVEAIAAGAGLDGSDEDAMIAALDRGAAPAGSPAPTPTPALLPARRASRSVRLSVDLLDLLMRGMADMTQARDDLARLVRIMDDPAPVAALERLSCIIDEVRDTVTRMRTQRIDSLFAPVLRLARDTAARTAKQVALSIEGGDVEVDRELIEALRDPLVHLVRNAIDHGIEAPQQRNIAGKPEVGQLTLTARWTEEGVIVTVSDDGTGVDVDALVETLAAREPSRAAALRALSPQARLDLILEAGVSSRDAVSDVSGRGVGMDVVRANALRAGGRVELVNRPGHGLSVSIVVPSRPAISPSEGTPA